MLPTLAALLQSMALLCDPLRKWKMFVLLSVRRCLVRETCVIPFCSSHATYSITTSDFLPPIIMSNFTAFSKDPKCCRIQSTEVCISVVCHCCCMPQYHRGSSNLIALPHGFLESKSAFIDSNGTECYCDLSLGLCLFLSSLFRMRTLNSGFVLSEYKASIVYHISRPINHI